MAGAKLKKTATEEQLIRANRTIDALRNQKRSLEGKVEIHRQVALEYRKKVEDYRGLLLQDSRGSFCKAIVDAYAMHPADRFKEVVISRAKRILSTPNLDNEE